MSWITFAALLADGERVRFSRDVRPILSEYCYACHGPDAKKREAERRLDTRAGLFGDAEKPGVVVPSELAESELWRRVGEADAAERMPPDDARKELPPEARATLRRWIEQGAPWEGHWAYEPPTRPAVPPAVTVAGAESWPRARNEIDAFLRVELPAHGLAPQPEADRRTLLRRLSLDLLGLPPTPVEIDAFLADPADDAYERQVDALLASPHYGERMAIGWLDLVRYADSVGYHGDQEVSVSPFRDWVIAAFNDNLPFDRFTLEQLAGDLLPEPTLRQQIASGYNRLGMMSAEGGVQPKEYLAKYVAERVRNLGGTWLGSTLGCCECHDHKYDPFKTKDFYSFEAFFADLEERGLYSGAESDGNWGPRIAVPTPAQAAELARLDGALVAARREYETETPELAAERAAWEAAPVAWTPLVAVALPPEVAVVLALEPAARSAEQQAVVAAHYRAITETLAPLRARLAELEQQRAALDASVTRTPVARSVAPREIRVHARGNWMDESGEVREPGFPAFLPRLDAPTDRRLTRLDFARWLVHPDHPLTARVFVNRLWKRFFGAGLSRRLDDFGSQGDWPSHPELLDWLARRFVDSGFDVKGMVRLLVTSAAYRQHSDAAAADVAADPDNRWFARQGRFRVEAEVIRDIALRVSGLLVEQIGGRSVHPYQPAGYWAYLNFPQREWQADAGESLYRRGLYVHWQRQYLHPSLLAFDAPSREECAADRSRSNTPLQALLLLNDPIYVEAARVFAEHLVREGGATTEARIAWGYARTVARPPKPAEVAVLVQLLTTQRAEHAGDPAAARALVAVGAAPVATDLDPVELAAWTGVARALLNLHETITRD